MSDPLSLEYTAGKLRFSWVEGAEHVEIYEIVGAGGIGDRVGFMELDFGEGRVPFEQDAFERHCDRFLIEAGSAEIRDETHKYDLQRVLGGNVLHHFEKVSHHMTVGMVGLVWGDIPESLEDPESGETEWKFHLGGEHWMIVKKVK